MRKLRHTKLNNCLRLHSFYCWKWDSKPRSQDSNTSSKLFSTNSQVLSPKPKPSVLEEILLWQCSLPSFLRPPFVALHLSIEVEFTTL